MEQGLKEKDLTSRIIRAAIAVHRHLGPGFLEAIYEEAMCIELDDTGIAYERQRAIPLTYRGRPIGEHRLDLLVGGRVVVELKAIAALDKIHFAVVRSYMKAVGCEVGLLLNFATMPLTVKRVGRETHEPIPDFLISKLNPEESGRRGI